MLYYVISDVHNHYTEMMTALSGKDFNINDPNQKVILVGDAFDRGEEAFLVFNFLKDLVDRDKLIYVAGNHDLGLLKRFKENSFPSHREAFSTMHQIASAYSGREDLSDSEVLFCCRAAGLEELLSSNVVPYFETSKYVFVHGSIPVHKGESNPEWRKTPLSSWCMPAMKNGMKRVMVDGIRVPGKTIVCGHSPAAYGNARAGSNPSSWADKSFDKVQRFKRDGSNKDLYKPYYGDGVIGIDANCYKTGFVNCIVIEEKE